MRKIYFLFSMLFASVFSMAQITVPLSFETGTFTWTDFSGGETTVIDNPQKTGINVSNKVSKTIKKAGDPWGGSWIGLTTPIDFSSMKTMRMKVYSPRVGAKVTLKVENGANGAINLEINANTTVANEWEDLSFNFNAILLPNTYDRVVVIFDNGTVGNGSANFTFLFDDIRQEAAGSGALTLPTLPVNFESATVDYAFTNFDGGGTTVVANTQKSGINTSDTVARLVKSAGQPWAGSFLTMAGAIDFTTNKTFKVKVFSPRANAKLLLKVEGAGAPFEREVTMTKANEWEELTFDYSAVSTVIQYNKLVFIFDLGTMGDGSANFTFLFDDIRLEAAGGGGLTQMKLPVTFDDATVNYGLIGFGGADASTIVADPTNAANKVGKVIKSATAELWAGTTITALGGGGFSEKIPFVVGSTFMNVRVWSPDAGIKVRVKVEDSGDPTKSVETEATTTVAGGWQTLVFDFTVPTVPATAPINYAFNYNKASIFFNFGVTGAAAGEKTYYFDDVLFGLPPTPPLTQMNLPVTFDNATVNYGLIGFGGAEASTIVADPTNAANKVAKVIKSATAELWAGTTITAPGAPAPGFSSKIPFAVGATKMNVRVWSPNAGIQVRLKVEDFTDGAKSVETEATTTVAGGWQNLVFDFTVPTVPATAPINYAFNYNKASIFFNFGVTGAAAGEKTYYFDDMVFGADPLPVKLLSFNAEKANQAVQLSWTTTNEVNNKEFGVQRSETGEKWNDIAVVKGQGTSNGVHTYSAEDKMPLPGVSYYRLRQTDLDGASVYSKVKVIDFSGIAMDAVKVYPNPAKGRLNVIANTFDGKVGYTIVGVDGRQVGSGMLQNTISATGINISNLKAGMYILKLQNNEKIKTVKFVVQ
jgi:hypothetical protein